MINWITGVSQDRSQIPGSGVGDGATFLDSAPETPAPLFAIRAFRTAIFGTPQPQNYEARDRKEDVLDQPEQCQISESKPRVESDDGGVKKFQGADCNSKTKKSEECLSPTKGILLTPGTATSKRKTVSFRGAKNVISGESDAGLKANVLESPLGKRRGQNQADLLPHLSRQSTLTKTLFEMSERHSGLKSADPTPSNEVESASITKQAPALDSDPTLDLSEPRSQSGQHWKQEFDEYYRKSDREMKKVIQHGQRVKIYALRKDCEANELNEKLETALSKVERLENRVKWLAKQLDAAHSQIPQDETNQARLMGELAQQAALTTQYQRKVKRYRKAMKRRSLTDNTDESCFSLAADLGHIETDDNAMQVTRMQDELKRLQESATSAERHVARLEDENQHLKGNLARVKEEMTSYEARRKTREERLKKREDKLRIAKEACEAELAQLKVSYQTILRGLSQDPPKDPDGPRVASKTFLEGVRFEQQPSNKPLLKGFDSNQLVQKSKQQNGSPSPRKKRSNQGVTMDIWVQRSPSPKEIIAGDIGTNTDGASPRPSVARQDIHRVLREINQNISIPEQRQQPLMNSNVKTQNETGEPPKPLRENKPGVSNDREAMLDIQPVSVTDGYGAEKAITHDVSWQGDAIFNSQKYTRAVSRTSTMGSVRTPSMSAERAAAAIARLAQKKRSGQLDRSLAT